MNMIQIILQFPPVIENYALWHEYFNNKKILSTKLSEMAARRWVFSLFLFSGPL